MENLQILEDLKLLEYEFIGTGEVKGSKFTQIHNCRNAYLYKVEPIEGKVHFEVFKRKNVAICIDFENHVYSDTEFKEIYPNSKDFGVWAWTYNSYDLALDKFEEFSY